MRASGGVAVVTDSSANLLADEAADAGVAVVPLRVVIGGVQYLEGVEIGGAELLEALRTKITVTTSRPSPHAFLAAYRELAAAGHQAVVSVHLSSSVSGTYESAVIAAQEAPIPVEVVDSRTLGLALGFAVLEAAEEGHGGADVGAVAAVARERSLGSRSFFYVDTMEHLRRGGRVGAVRAAVGSALAVKPLLHVRDGVVEMIDKVRTSSRARARLVDLAAEAAGPGPVRLGVQHLGAAERAHAIAGELMARVSSAGSVVGDVVVREVGAAIGAHVGPGMVAVVVAPAGRPPTGAPRSTGTLTG